MLVIDQGSRSTYVYAFIENRLKYKTKKSHTLIQDNNGKFEFDPEEIYCNIILAISEIAKQMVKDNVSLKCIKSCSLAIQRSSMVIFDKDTETSVCGISWGDTRCKEVVSKYAEHENEFLAKTGQTMSYLQTIFKYKWYQEQFNYTKQESHIVGTLDTYLMYRFFGRLVTESSMASHTGLYNINTNYWDQDLLKLFDFKQEIELVPSNQVFGTFSTGPFKVPLNFVIGNAQAGFFVNKPKEVKISMGYGSFMLCQEQLKDSVQTVVTAGYHDSKFKIIKAYEQYMPVATGYIDWLRQIHILDDTPLDDVLLEIDNSNGILFVPSENLLTGASFSSKPAHFAFAVLEGIALEIRAKTLEIEDKTIRISGGVSRSNKFCQILANVCQCEVVREEQMTARGCAYGLQATFSAHIKIFKPEVICTENIERWNKVKEFKAQTGALAE